MPTTLLLAQSLLGVVFFLTGVMKLGVPTATLKEKMKPLRAYPAPMIYALGLLEIVGAAGVSLQPLVGFERSFVILAALGLGFVMVGATVVQARDRNWPMVAVNLLLLCLSLFVAFMHWSWTCCAPPPM